MERYPHLTEDGEENTPVMVTAVGAIDKMKQRFGFPMSVPVALTTYSESLGLMQDLKARGYDNLYFRYTGWMNEGVTHTYPKKISLVSELGKQQRS